MHVNVPKYSKKGVRGNRMLAYSCNKIGIKNTNSVIVEYGRTRVFIEETYVYVLMDKHNEVHKVGQGKEWRKVGVERKEN